MYLQVEISKPPPPKKKTHTRQCFINFIEWFCLLNPISVDVNKSSFCWVKSLVFKPGSNNFPVNDARCPAYPYHYLGRTLQNPIMCKKSTNNGNDLIIYYKVGIQVWKSTQSIIIVVLIKKIEHHSHSGIQIKILRTNLQQFILDRKQLNEENNDII